MAKGVAPGWEGVHAHWRGLPYALLVLSWVAPIGVAQDCDLPDECFDRFLIEPRGFTAYEDFSLSTDSFGQLFRFDTNLGYDFNRHFSADAGIPLYIAHDTRPPTDFSAFKRTGGGPGDAYIDLRFTLPLSSFTFTSILTGTAPTGRKSAGLSTGRATFSWDNRLERDVAAFHLFGAVGVANSIYDTTYFVRPFTTLGFVTHLEAGGLYRVRGSLSVGVSPYADLTSGQQKLFSRLLSVGGRPQTAPPPSHEPPNAPPGLPPPSFFATCTGATAFACAAETVGSAALTRDYGGTAWAMWSATRELTFRAAYTRSVGYNFNTFSAGVTVRLEPLFHKAGGALIHRGRDATGD